MTTAKTMKKKIGINMKHAFSTMIESTSFGTKTSFLVELIQNTQRANAENVYITLQGKELTIQDDGNGCDLPTKVFNISESGFGVGFGQGFTSVYGLKGQVEVRSNNWKAKIDVQKLIEEGLPEENIGYDLEWLEEEYKGFIVKITSEEIEKMYQEIQDVVIQTVQHIEDINYYLNGMYVVKKGLYDEFKNRPFSLHFNNRYASGILSPLNENQQMDYDSKSGVDVYFEKRFVCNLSSGFHNYYGVIELKPKKVDLNSPDRTKIVENDKFYDFKLAMRKVKQDVATQILKEDDGEHIDQYAQVIKRELNIEKVIRHLAFDDQDYLGKIEDEEVVDEIEEQDEEQQLTIGSIETFVDERKREDYSFTSFVSEEPKETDTLKKKDLKKQKITDLKKYKNVFWCEKDNVEYHKDKIAEYEYYNAICFISKNSLYSDALEFLGIKHVSQLDERTIKKQYDIKNPNPKTKKEKRAIELLRFVEKAFDLSNVFFISNIEMKKEIQIYEGKSLHKEKMQVGGYTDLFEINLNRKFLLYPKGLENKVGSEEFNKNDALFLLMNIEVIAHEMAHFIYCTKDNTKEHYEKITLIQKRLTKKIHEKLMN